MDKIKIGIVVASDRAFKGTYEDISGKAIKEVLTKFILNECEYFYRLVEDNQEHIESTFIELCHKIGCDLVISSGGTGPALRDVTPEATEKVCQKMLPGFGELMRQSSLKFVPTAILSRQTAGICNQSLIVNLPGKPKSIKECLEAVFPAIPYCIDLIGGQYIQANTSYISVFRPKN